MKDSWLKELIVWMIIFIGLVIFSAFVYVIGSNKNSFFNWLVTYKTLLVESNGINMGTKVAIHGKNTGNVVKTTLLPNGNVEVLFTVRKNHIFSITESSLVQLEHAGALGDRFINILTEDLSAPQLEKGSLIPYKESSNLMSILTENEGDTQKKLQNLIEQIDGILSSFNKEKPFGLLSKDNKDDLTQILKSTKNIVKRVESGQGTLGALINDRSLYNRLLVLLGQRPVNNYLKELSQKSQDLKK